MDRYTYYCIFFYSFLLICMSLVETIISTHTYVGTTTKNAHPKTKKYWLSANYRGNIIINPEIIAQQLESARTIVKTTIDANKQILVICEKALYADELGLLSQSKWFHYFDFNTPAWVLTNFDTLLHRINSMNQLKKFVLTEEFKMLTKKEQLVKKRELAKIQRIYKWVENLKKIPDMIVIVDAQALSKFVLEVIKLNKTSIILANTDFNKHRSQDGLIMMNVNNHKSIDIVFNYLFS